MCTHRLKEIKDFINLSTINKLLYSETNDKTIWPPIY